MAGHFDGRRLRLEEVHRFANEGVRLPTGWHWDALGLFRNISRGLAAAKASCGDSLASVAVDTWGVDYGLLDGGGRLLGPPWMYRDERTDGMIEIAADLVPREEIYRRTGIQFMFFNTIFQLLAETRRHGAAVAAAERLLFMPDLLTYWLSGERVVERTIASTSQLLKVGQAEWDFELVEKLGLPAGLLHSLTEPGVVVGTLLPQVRDETGCGALQVTTCGAHDTASAVAGVPSRGPQPLFLSSGTWSLLGRELDGPLVTNATYAAGFSNEQGLGGSTRFLKNVAGMWLLQECRRNWETRGLSVDFPRLVAEAESAETPLLLNPDAEEFARPCDMPAVIAAYAERTGQSPPASPGETSRAILQSLALRYRQLILCLREWMPDLPDTLHVVGGGAKNALLNQMTADATGLRVVAGPVEATAAGNVVAQLMATGRVTSLGEGRAIIRDSFELEEYEPRDCAQWEEMAGRFGAVTERG